CSAPRSRRIASRPPRSPTTGFARSGGAGSTSRASGPSRIPPSTSSTAATSRRCVDGMVLAAPSGMAKLGERETYAGAAAAILLAGVLHELYRIFVVPWPHITPLLSVAMSTLLVVVWAAAIVTVLR